MSSERAHGGDAGDSETRSPYSPASWDGATTDSAERLPAGTEAGEPSAAEAAPDVTVPNKGADEGDDAEAAEPTADSLATHPDSVEDAGPGRRLGIDVGGVRVGVAMSDPAPVLATPVETVRRDRRKGTDLRRVVRLVSEYEIVEVIIGLPVTMGGEHGHAAEMARGFASALAPRITPVPVRFSDERLTTVTASRMLFERGVRGKQQRSVVDQAAAVEILQSWLDARGRGAGKDCW